ncbi:hypothetical protein MA16_Dca021412 [Dendrobium catenatum]|uniref:Uncharacterized protein n=1 Tax=Dendrobium catenatum TaxID=906689 RepID=A0A2I0WIZ3_9ASPA|nr:hypothetical protein MA16_Dca021412 [Dendrobium catenatum]
MQNLWNRSSSPYIKPIHEAPLPLNYSLSNAHHIFISFNLAQSLHFLFLSMSWLQSFKKLWFHMNFGNKKRRGIYILYEDVKSCPYEDVHVLWSILVKSHRRKMIRSSKQ